MRTAAATDFATARSAPLVEARLDPFNPRRPPPGVDALVEWFDRFGSELVRLAEYPLPVVEAAVETFSAAVRAHLAAADPPDGFGVGSLRPVRERLLEGEHARFRTSLEQLAWFLSVVRGEDHGGHRQALGQYMRVLAEAFRLHRDEEDPRPSRAPDRSATPAGDRSPGNPK